MDAFDIIAVLVALFPVLVLVAVNAAESLKSDPELPDYQHAQRTGASPHTVKSVRESIPDLQNANDGIRLNARGQERPASYSKDTPDPEPELVAGGAVRSDMEKTGEIRHFEKRQDPRTGNVSKLDTLTDSMGSVRRELKSTGEIRQSETRVSGDGRAEMENDGRLEQYSSRTSGDGSVRRELVDSGQVRESRTSRGADGKVYPASQPERPDPEPEHATLVPKPELTSRPLGAQPRRCNSSHFVTRGVPRVPAEVVNKGGE